MRKTLRDCLLQRSQQTGFNRTFVKDAIRKKEYSFGNQKIICKSTPLYFQILLKGLAGSESMTRKIIK